MSEPSKSCYHSPDVYCRVEDIKKQLAHYPALYPRAEQKVVLTKEEKQEALAQAMKQCSDAREALGNPVGAGSQEVLRNEEEKAIATAQQKKALDQENERAAVVEGIKAVLDPANRKYLSVFRLDRDANLMETIVRAVFNCK